MLSGTHPQNHARRHTTTHVDFLLLAVCGPIICHVCLDVLTDVHVCVDLVLINSVIMVIWQLAGYGQPMSSHIGSNAPGLMACGDNDDILNVMIHCWLHHKPCGPLSHR